MCALAFNVSNATFDPSASTIEISIMRRSVTVPSWLSNFARGSPFVDDTDRRYHQESPTIEDLLSENGAAAEVPLPHKGLAKSEGSIASASAGAPAGIGFGGGAETLKMISDKLQSPSSAKLVGSSSVPRDLDLSKFIGNSLLREKSGSNAAAAAISNGPKIVKSKPIDIGHGRTRGFNESSSGFKMSQVDDSALRSAPNSRKGRKGEKGWKQRLLQPRDLNLLAPCSL